MNCKKTAIATGLGLGLLGMAAYAQPYLQPVHGPGMMGSEMMGSGMMGGQHMGPGMMRGPGGPSMMGDHAGFGMGPGMMGAQGLGPIHRLSLSDEQRSQLTGIEGDLRKQNWELMGQMQQEMVTMHQRGSPGMKADRGALLAANKRMFELRQKMLENRLEAQDKAEALLTPQQKEQYQRFVGWGCDTVR